MWTLSFQQGWPAREPQRPSCLHLTWPALRLKAGTTVFNFVVVAAGPDSGDHACSENTLPIEPSSQFPEENSSKSKTHGGPHLCIHVLMYTCTYASVHLCIYAPMYLCIHAPLHPCIHAPMYPCTYASVHSCTYAEKLHHMHT